MSQSAPSPSPNLMRAVDAQLEAMSPTMRIASGFLLFLLGGIVIFFLWWFLYGSLDAKAADIRKRKQNLMMVQSVYNQLVDAEARLEGAETRLRGSAEAKRKASGYIEKTAADSGIKDTLGPLQEQGSPEMIGNLKQTRYKVAFKKAPLAGLVDFIYSIESSGFLQVESLDFRTTFVSGEKRINANFTLLAFQIVESE